ncbi:AAA family ATPase [uncultured Desulfobacter sp.]|uniref:ExeA family protein n=1 Tax=uncultured Desulfobacter sp. TaxID=240139 RepID=UPI002AA7A6F7|nr:AAA family ATPase [uncultured Desulfobacter sp.]
MYNTFFNLREKPFQLVPNPDFLFLGKSHEDALAHLTYAVSQGDGFVKITGEVGTGKTTLCRVFLEKLGSNTEAAFIFNSKVNAIQLLKMVHRELGIKSCAEDPCDLTHDLNTYLLEKKAAGISVILLIDEAQNLAKETLEQLRMLSNLETTRSKLLQIILVGQPELRDLLDHHELRQLKQRINISCHIRPLGRQETLDYISHRISVASNRPQSLFTPSALKGIYAFSIGIPRLINIICDRALLVAYSRQRKKVSARHVAAAVRELESVNSRQRVSWKSSSRKVAAAAFAALILITAAYTLYANGIFNRHKTVVNTISETNSSQTPSEITPSLAIQNNKVAPARIVKPVSEPSLSPEPDLAMVVGPLQAPAVHPVEAAGTPPQLPPLEGGDVRETLLGIQSAINRKEAFGYLAALWKKPVPEKLAVLDGQIAPNDYFFKIAAAGSGLKLLTLDTDLRKALKLNLPVIFEYRISFQYEKGFAGIEAVTPDNHCILFTGAGQQKYRVPMAELLPFLNGKMYIAWEDGLGANRIISDNGPKDAVITLKLLLSELGFPMQNFSPAYDTYVQDALRQVQNEAGIAQDGIAGPETRIALLRKSRGDGVPQLSASPLNHLNR